LQNQSGQFKLKNPAEAGASIKKGHQHLKQLMAGGGASLPRFSDQVLKALAQDELKLEKKIQRQGAVSSFFSSAFSWLKSKVGLDKKDKEDKKELDHLLKKFAQEQRAYMQAIIDINWALFDIAAKDGHPFTSGGMVVLDPQQHLFNYFKNYVVGVNKEVVEPKDRQWVVTGHCLGYSRESSHYAEEADQHGQYGIDVRFLEDTGKVNDSAINDLLPNNKSHILFGELRQIRAVFIKLEFFGLCADDGFLKHALEYLKGGAEGGVKCKEHLPSDIKDFIKKSRSKDIKSLQKNVKKIGIKDVDEWIKKYPKDKDALILSGLIKEKYNDNVGIRKGSEVIIDLTNLSRYQ
jgi:hypothetical protein